MYQFKKMIKVLLLCLLTACNGNDKEYSVISPEQEIEAGGSSDYTELLTKHDLFRQNTIKNLY